MWIRNSARRSFRDAARILLALFLVQAVCAATASVSFSYAKDPVTRLSATPVSSKFSETDRPVQGKVLVLAAEKNDFVLDSIRQALEYTGVPYDLWVATERTGELVRGALSDGKIGNYQAVMLTSATLAHSADGGKTWGSALTEPEWTALSQYEVEFRVRRVSWYAFPTADLGFSAATNVNAGAVAITASLTPLGQQTFDYLQPDVRLRLEGNNVYLAKPLDSSVAPLLVDQSGNALMSVRTLKDGREQLVMGFEPSPLYLETAALSFGVVRWVTRGIFLGQRKVALTAQIDDVFIPDRLYTGLSYRMTADDLETVLAWQRRIQADPLFTAIQLDMVYNGRGIPERVETDALSAKARENQDQFRWISHTYSHLDMDGADSATSASEIRRNDETARSFGMTGFSRLGLVSGNVSGLNNRDFLRALADSKRRYIVSDTSKPEQANPSPNSGIQAPDGIPILFVPRRPNNLYFDVSTPEEWLDQYNKKQRGVWKRDLTYAEMLDKESSVLVRYLLRGDLDPWMFHQSNLRAYEPGKFLLADLLDEVLAKYRRISSVPLISPAFDEIGQRFADRMSYDKAGVMATITPGKALTIHGGDDVIVPVTGIDARGATQYGPDSIGYFRLRAGGSVDVPLDGTAASYDYAGWLRSNGSPAFEAGAAFATPPDVPFTPRTAVLSLAGAFAALVFWLGLLRLRRVF